MLIIYMAAIFGIFRFRSKDYWKWLAILFAWMLIANVMFYAGGTLEDPTGDGLITRQIRLATADGPGMALFAIAFIVTYWGGVIWMVRKMYLVGKQAEADRCELVSQNGGAISTERKVAEAVAVTIAAATYAYFTLVEPQADNLNAKSATTYATETQTIKDPVAEELKRAAYELNRSAPQKIDEVTTLKGATASGRVLTYQYAISREDISAEQLRQFVRQNVIPSACQDTSMRNAMRDHDVTYRYSYKIQKRQYELLFDATFSDCEK